MTRKWCILATIIVAFIAVGMIACKNDDGTPSGPSPIEYTPPTSSTTNTTSNPPANPPAAPSGITFEWTRGKDFFGSGFSCSRDGVGTTWKSPIVEVKVTNNTDGEIEMGYQVFGDREPGCAATVNGRSGAKDIFVLLEGPETLGPGESAIYRWRIDLNQFPGVMCGRWQFGWGFNDSDGTFHNERDRVINTGEENCSPPPPPPPPPGCPANDDSFINATPTEGDGQYCWGIEWGTSQSPCSVTQDGVEISTACTGDHGPVCFDPGPESVDHEWRLKAGKCDPFAPVTVPPRGDPCADSHLTIVDSWIDGNTLYVKVNSSSAGTVSALGAEENFGSGESTVSFPIPPEACGQVIDISATNQCEDTASDEVQTDDCPVCEDTHLDFDCEIDGDTLSCEVNSSGPGVMSALGGDYNFGAGNSSIDIDISNVDCDEDIEVVAETECDEVDDTFTTDECPEECEDIPATSQASQPFSLANSGQSAETTWVNNNVSPGPYAFGGKDEDFDDESCTLVGGSAKVVLLKAGTNYWYFLNVDDGDQLCSGSQNAISHLSFFECADPD